MAVRRVRQALGSLFLVLSGQRGRGSSPSQGNDSRGRAIAPAHSPLWVDRYMDRAALQGHRARAGPYRLPCWLHSSTVFVRGLDAGRTTKRDQWATYVAPPPALPSVARATQR